MCVSPENGEVGCLHQHIHQRIYHLCVEDDGIHHFTKLLVISYTKAGFRDAGVGLQEGKHNKSKHEEKIKKNMKTKVMVNPLWSVKPVLV